VKFILLIASFNAFFFTVLLLQKRPRALHDIILILWLLYLGLFIGVYSFYSHELFTHFQLLSVSFISLFMLHGLFLYYYILSLVSDKKEIQNIDFLHFIPFILFNLYLLIASFLPETAVKLNIESLSMDYDPPLLFLFFLILTALSGTVYFLFSIKLFRKLDINIFNNYSNSKEINLSWLRKLILIFGIIWTSLMTVTIIHHVFHMFSMLFCTDGLFLSLSVFVILIGYFGLKQKVIFYSESIIVSGNSTEIQTKYAGSKLKDSEAKLYVEKLDKHMDSSKPHLNPDLTLLQLASEINITPHLLSQIINDHYKLNFFDYINQHRVQEFQAAVADPKNKNYSLLGIAFECGFNSKSAFNRMFKKSTGLTPSQFKESNFILRG
jgi:AraC-like DNA-binding protein